MSMRQTLDRVRSDDVYAYKHEGGYNYTSTIQNDSEYGVAKKFAKSNAGEAVIGNLLAIGLGSAVLGLALAVMPRDFNSILDLIRMVIAIPLLVLVPIAYIVGALIIPVAAITKYTFSGIKYLVSSAVTSAKSRRDASVTN